jgi:hypothetical protein
LVMFDVRTAPSSFGTPPLSEPWRSTSLSLHEFAFAFQHHNDISCHKHKHMTAP